MNINWKKSLLVVCDIVIAAYLVMAVTAFNKPDQAVTRCTEVKTDIEANIVDGFLTADEINKMLRQEKVYPLGCPSEEPLRGDGRVPQVAERARLYQGTSACPRGQGDGCQWR